MIGRDFNAFPVQHRTWVVNNTPDFDGYYYSGLKSGPEPFIDVSAYSVVDGYAIVDFNLPNPINWATTYKVMPKLIYNSQLAILDGYAYMFGGTTDGYGNDGYGTTNKIFMMNLNNPTDWWDSGAILPDSLCLSQLAIIGDKLYLFGGFNKGKPVDKIYYALTAEPLTWIDTNATIPKKLHSSTLGITNNFIYLYGGFGVDIASDVICSAPISNPLSWTLTSSVLPNKLYNSQIGHFDGYFYLFGGMTSPNTITNNIYRTSPNNRLSVYVVGTLPAGSCNSQFFTIANKGYLIGPTSPSSNETNIFVCNSLLFPAIWTNINETPGQNTVISPGQVTRSQIAIIDDQLFLFGGDGSTVIWTDKPILKYSFTNPSVLKYGLVTRTQYDAISNPLDRLALLGFPWWKTNYGG